MTREVSAAAANNFLAAAACRTVAPPRRECYLVLAAALIFSQAGVAHAQEKPGAHLPNSGECVLDANDFKELDFIKTDLGAGYSERIKRELEIRRSLLSKTVNCAVEEISGLELDFNGIQEKNRDVAILKSQFRGWFPDTLNYYAIQKSKISSLGLQGSKDFAQNLKDWRDGNYKPTAKIVSNFKLWAQNQELLDTAKNRLRQADFAIELVKDSSEYWGIRSALRDAEADLYRSLSSNQRVKELLRAYAPAEESLDAIKSSLKLLAGTYEKLFKVIESINAAIVKS